MTYTYNDRHYWANNRYGVKLYILIIAFREGADMKLKLMKYNAFEWHELFILKISIGPFYRLPNSDSNESRTQITYRRLFINTTKSEKY